jgi:hypothetical protein
MFELLYVALAKGPGRIRQGPARIGTSSAIPYYQPNFGLKMGRAKHVHDGWPLLSCIGRIAIHDRWDSIYRLHASMQMGWAIPSSPPPIPLIKPINPMFYIPLSFGSISGCFHVSRFID